jgi:hypothetical protein
VVFLSLTAGSLLLLVICGRPGSLGSIAGQMGYVSNVVTSMLQVTNVLMGLRKFLLLN